MNKVQHIISTFLPNDFRMSIVKAQQVMRRATASSVLFIHQKFPNLRNEAKPSERKWFKRW